MKRSISVVLFAILLVGAGQRLAYAQLTAQINGTITDPSGAVIPGATVSLTNEGTGIKWEAKTNQFGIYTVPYLQPGDYRIEVQAAGFRAVSRSGIRLQVAQTGSVDFRLELGAAAESIDVTDTAPLLNAGSGAMGGVISPEKVENLPMLGRNSNALMLLAPGVRATRQTIVNPVLESHYQFFSINGSRPNQSQFILDGGNNSNLTFNGPEYSPQVEEVQEFRIQTSSFSAEYAMAAGGVINVATRGGTNELHGSLFEYLRNDKLAANDFFSNLAGRPRTTLRYNQFGGTVGGPIMKNQAFFFFSYEGLRQHLPAIITTSVPTALQKAGDFSQTFTSAGQMRVIYDPFSTAPDPARPGQYLRTPLAGNRIPANRIDPVSAKIQSYYPAPTSLGDPGTGLNNFFFTGASIRTTNNYSGRVDHQLNSSTMITARYSRESMPNWTNPATFGKNNIATPGYVTKPQHHPYAVGKVTKTFSPTLFAEFVLSWGRMYYESFAMSNGFDPTELGFPAYLAANSKRLGFPGIGPGEMSSLGTYYNEHDVADRIEGKANVSKVSGKHTIKFGGLYGLGRYTTRVFNNSAGSYSFNFTFTQGPNPLVSSPTGGFGYASFLLGTMSGGTHNVTDWDGAYTSPYFGGYIQDDFKVTPRLTLNLGMRWDYEGPRTEEKNRVANFDFTSTGTLANGTPITGGMQFPGVSGTPRGSWERNSRNIAPRFGFAYNLKDATVLRGGYGIFYANSWGNGRNNQALPQTGFSCSTAVVTSLDNGLTPYAVLSNPFPTGFCKATGSSAGLATNLGTGLFVLDRNQKVPYVQSWNFDIQRKLPAEMVVEIAYSGSRGIHLMGIQEWGQLHPQYMQLGSQLNSQVRNPYAGVVTSGPLAQPTITLGQALRPYPQYLGVSTRNATYGNSIYQAMFLKLERRFSRGFSVVASYTVAKEIDDMIPSVNGFPGESFSGAPPQNFYDLRGERALSSWDTPQTLVISYVYELPFGPGKPFLSQRGAIGKIVGGWQINGTTVFQSGSPLQINGGNSSGTMAGTQRPNWSGKDATLSGPIADRRARYFDTSAFSLNAPFTFGNAPRIMPNLRGPGQKNFDISVFKNTSINERFRLQFRAEAFNAFNRVQFGMPNTSITSPSFGLISSQQNLPRNIQLGMRLLF